MKKRILSILVICCMVLGLLPTTAFADNDSVKKAIQIGTSGISGYDSTNSSYDYIHFGTWNNSTVKWRVLDTKTNMANAQRGDGFFLLSEVLLGTGEYGGVEFDYTTPYFNDWKGSRGQDWCNDFYSKVFWQPAKVMLYMVCTMTLLTTSWMGTRCFFSRQRKRKMQPTDLPMTMRVSPIMAIVHTYGGSVLLGE